MTLAIDHRPPTNPFVMGDGIPLFAGLTTPHRLDLVEHETVPGGVVLATYRSVPSSPTARVGRDVTRSNPE